MTKLPHRGDREWWLARCQFFFYRAGGKCWFLLLFFKDSVTEIVRVHFCDTLWKDIPQPYSLRSHWAPVLLQWMTGHKHGDCAAAVCSPLMGQVKGRSFKDVTPPLSLTRWRAAIGESIQSWTEADTWWYLCLRSFEWLFIHVSASKYLFWPKC